MALTILLILMRFLIHVAGRILLDFVCCYSEHLGLPMLVCFEGEHLWISLVCRLVSFDLMFTGRLDLSYQKRHRLLLFKLDNLTTFSVAPVQQCMKRSFDSKCADTEKCATSGGVRSNFRSTSDTGVRNIQEIRWTTPFFFLVFKMQFSFSRWNCQSAGTNEITSLQFLQHQLGC